MTKVILFWIPKKKLMKTMQLIYEGAVGTISSNENYIFKIRTIMFFVNP